MISDTIPNSGERPQAARSTLGVIRLGELKYVAVIVLLIVLPYQNTLNLLIGFSTRPLILGLLALLFVSGLWKMSVSKQKLHLFDQVVLLWLGMSIIYIPMTIITAESITRGIVAGVFGVLTQCQGFLAYFAIRGLQLSSLQVTRLLKVMLVSLVIMVGYGVYEYFWGQYQLIDWIVEHSQHPYILAGDFGFFRQRYGSVFYRSQSFELEFVSFGYSGYVLSCILFAVVILSRQARKRKALWLALGLSVLGLLSSVTLSGIAILLLTFGVLSWEAWRRRGNARFVLFLLPTLGIIAFLVIWALSPTIADTIDQELGHQQSIVRRLLVHMNGALHYIQNLSPYEVLLGRGLGTSGPGAERFFSLQIENEYIGNLAETGLVGLIVYLLLIASMVYHVRYIKRRYRWGSLGYAVGVGLFCVTLGYILIGFSHNVWGQSSIDIQFMILLALWTKGNKLFDSI